MNEPAPEPPPPPPPANRCTLCDTAVDPGAQRCPSCGLWKAGHGEPGAGPVLARVAAAFVALYVVTLVVVAVAR